MGMNHKDGGHNLLLTIALRCSRRFLSQAAKAHALSIPLAGDDVADYMDHTSHSVGCVHYFISSSTKPMDTTQQRYLTEG